MAGREGEEASRGSAGKRGARVCCPDKLSNSPKVTQLVKSETGAQRGGSGTQTAPTPSPVPLQVGRGAASRLLNHHMTVGQPCAKSMNNFNKTAQDPPHPTRTEVTPRFTLGAGARQP